MRLITLDQYRTMPRPSVNWLIHRLIPKPGKVLLLGAPKQGKTTLALQLGLAVAHGTPFLGRDVHKGRVLFLQFDTAELIWRTRLQDFVDAGVDVTGDVFMPHPDDLMSPMIITSQAAQAWLTVTLHDAKPDLVIVDILREVHHDDENDSTRMKVVGDILFRHLAPYSCIILHHITKPKPDVALDPVTAARGSGYIAGKVDVLMLLDKDIIKIKSRVEADSTVPCKMDRKTGLWTFPTLTDIHPDTQPKTPLTVQNPVKEYVLKPASTIQANLPLQPTYTPPIIPADTLVVPGEVIDLTLIGHLKQ